MPELIEPLSSFNPTFYARRCGMGSRLLVHALGFLLYVSADAYQPDLLLESSPTKRIGENGLGMLLLRHESIVALWYAHDFLPFCSVNLQGVGQTK